MRTALRLAASTAIAALLLLPSIGYAKTPEEAPEEAPAGIPETPPARMEVAFVLDTTGSMSGLIEGAKKKIWSIASHLQDLEPKPQIRFALIGYRDRGDAYVTKRFDLTEDVQKIYGELLTFAAEGGGDTPESVNQALAEAINDLAWSREDDVFRAAFLVGDAPPHMDYQDDVPYRDTLKVAKARDIIVNTIQAGSMQDTTPIWQEIARFGGGDFARIAQDGAMVEIKTPYDIEIQKVQSELGTTVIPYGKKIHRDSVRSKAGLSAAAPEAAAADMADYLRKSAKSKVVTGGGDLVEELEEGRLDADDLATENLPEAMQAMSPAERQAEIDAKRSQRAALKGELETLLEKRAAYLAEQEKAAPAPLDSFDREVRGMIAEQAARKGFTPAER
ncbi:MAG: VWA domain-containing protein [Neomegalonema sp.]|nr:VWA domain-containing protein [Neomegalonema sp.]